MARYGLAGPSYTLRSPISDNEALVNGFCVQPETSGATSGMTIYDRPGLAIKYSLPETAIPGEFEVNGRAFVAGASFYELLANGTYTNWGTLNGPPLTPTQICCCQTHLLILSNGDLYVFVLVGVTDSNGVFHPPNSFLAVDMAQFNGPVLQIDFCDGYFFAVIQNSNTFQVSNLEDGTTWNGLFISTISYFPDNIVSMKVDHREVWFLSPKKTIAYYNSGAGFPPFIPIQAAFLEDGCGATFGTVQVNDTIAWIEANDRGQGIAKMMGNYIGIRISTLAVEFAWQNYPTIADAVAYTYQEEGHNFWVIRFPSANKTWAYNFSSSTWSEWGFWNQNTGTYSAHRATSHMFFAGMHLVGDWASGNIYQQSMNISMDFGNVMRRFRQSPTIMNENRWIYFSLAEFLVEAGLGPIPPLLDGNGQPRGPQLMLQWSNNGGKTWGNVFYLDCGQAGEYGKRIRKVMLGRARKRQFRIIWTDPVPFRILDGYVEANSEGKPIYPQGERLSEQYRKIS